jgi:3-methyladenine DNA glycosylase AlkC
MMVADTPAMEPLKEQLFNCETIGEMADHVRRTHRRFDKVAFMRRVFTTEWADLELKQRMRHVTEALHDTLDLPFRRSADVLSRAARDGRGFVYMSLADYIELYGQDEFETSVAALREITKACSSEFAVRPFIVADQDRMLRVMRNWAGDPDARVRRLASEGCRPRLPWAIALPALKKDPAPIMPILEALKDDPSEDVRRSVANNLNDISKDNPGFTLDVARRWHGENAQRDALVKHGLRTLLKKGSPDALALLGCDSRDVRFSKFKLARTRVAIGSDLEFSFEVATNAPTRVRLEYALTFLTKTGGRSRKVFKAAEGVIHGRKSFSRRRSFRDLSTRKHYPGPHTIAIIVNGREVGKKRFALTAPI